ncbi:hypothetical protein D5085_01550 [Ectothiorhodospiraceae bacterium BW-2]|nr:hypothetical protein D5085_01550 [Ectothiorhodospiraceae bacterium BW-2]
MQYDADPITIGDWAEQRVWQALQQLPKPWRYYHTIEWRRLTPHGELEADVVILAGITRQAARHAEWLYVGASRARVLLYLLALRNAELSLSTTPPVIPLCQYSG